MRKFVILFLVCFSLCFCSFFKSKTIPYPKGIVFPLAEDGAIRYQGEIIDHICREGKNLYLSTEKGFVYAIDGKGRKIVWSFKAGENLESPPYLGQNNIYIYDKEATLYCLHKEGKLLWKKKIEERITSGIREYGGRIYMGTERGVFFALDRTEGKELWTFRTGEAIRSTPIFAEGMIIFGCDDHNLYFLDEEGHVVDKFETGDKIQATPLVDGRVLYCGSDDQNFYCLDLKRRRTKWKVKTGCRIQASPVTDRKRVFLLCWNGVLYCLNKKNGTILWWKSIPARSSYQLALIEDRVVVTALSYLLVCFDVKTGEKVGDFGAEETIQSNPLWLEPHLLINLYDSNKKEGSLLYLKKFLQVNLEPSKPSPQLKGEELVFTASVTGFFMPKYEFYTRRLARVDFNPAFSTLFMEWEKNVVQKISEKNSWAWLPERPGAYFIGLNVIDEKERGEIQIPYLIEKEKPKVTLFFSKESPQKTGEEISFNARASGLDKPKYEFYLNRLSSVDFNPAFFIIYSEWEKTLTQEKSEMNSWVWSPENPGAYVVGVKAVDEREKAESMVPFLVMEKKQAEMRDLIFFLRYWVKIFIGLLLGF